MKSFRIGVVGSGAIGSYYGGKLAAAGGDVHFLMRGDLTEIRREGLHIRCKGEDIRIAKTNVNNSTKEIGPCDLVLIAVKTTSNEEIVDLIPPLLHERTMLLTLQNGLGNEEFLAKHFGQERVLGGVCFICLSRTSRTAVERYDYGHIVLGEYERKARERTHEMAERFENSGVPCRVTDDLALERWRKLVWNIPFNGLSILAGGVDTAAILEGDDLRRAAGAPLEKKIVGGKRG